MCKHCKSMLGNFGYCFECCEEICNSCMAILNPFMHKECFLKVKNDKSEIDLFKSCQPNSSQPNSSQPNSSQPNSDQTFEPLRKMELTRDPCGYIAVVAAHAGTIYPSNLPIIFSSEGFSDIEFDFADINTVSGKPALRRGDSALMRGFIIP